MGLGQIGSGHLQEGVSRGAPSLWNMSMSESNLLSRTPSWAHSVTRQDALRRRARTVRQVPLPGEPDGTRT